ncbi:MAG TPA: carboxylating nicotinate-nucleotide diphosphorylase [Phycisphaerales bacterium]|nr:carboxylating nicotinate-nucleotide diphosphorylase [Phycisphaerales bacterium]
MLDLNSLPLPRLFAELTADGCLDRLVDAALDEDLRDAGDVTSDSIIDPVLTAEALVVARSAGVAGGLACGQRICGEHVRFESIVKDGDAFGPRMTLAKVAGPLRHILGVERTLLNIIGRLSGIATVTSRFVEAIKGTNAVVCDTRKTTPGMRNLEKYAVRCGGGTLHRIGLYDAALYKDNHLALIPPEQLAETVKVAAIAARRYHDLRFVEVEVDSLEQLKRLLTIEPGVIDIVLLDNMPPPMMREAVKMRDTANASLQLEASGGVNHDTVRAIAESGVDRISIGALTHSVACLDVGLDIAT